MSYQKLNDDPDLREKIARERAAQAWTTETTKARIFDAQLAIAFADILRVEMWTPNLGCATTQELIEELKARLPELERQIEFIGTEIKDPNYRTVDGD